MTEEPEAILFEKYPTLFKDKDKPCSETCMCWGLCCASGWSYIIDDMCNSLMDLQSEYDIDITFDQIKEKYGVLRVYYHFNLGKRWTYIDKIHYLDGKKEIEKVSLGRTYCDIKTPAYENVQNQIDEIIRTAEKFSSITCEKCGMTSGKANSNGWITTMCDKCRTEANKE